MNYLQEIHQYLKQLSQETEQAKQSKFFKDYLETMSRFWNYSYYNQLLIHFQYPSATRIAGIRTWNKSGRNIIKGSKAIRILAPKLKKEEDEDIITGFTRVSVFDISQTEGKKLPEINIDTKGENKELMKQLLSFCKERSIEVKFRQLETGTYGFSAGGSIVIDNKASVNTQINTLIHEIAHELLHKGSNLTKEVKEIQAEAVAYIVSRHFGLQPKSFNYLALYDADERRIMENIKEIAGCVREIITGTKQETKEK